MKLGVVLNPSHSITIWFSKNLFNQYKLFFALKTSTQFSKYTLIQCLKFKINKEFNYHHNRFQPSFFQRIITNSLLIIGVAISKLQKELNFCNNLFNYDFLQLGICKGAIQSQHLSSLHGTYFQYQCAKLFHPRFRVCLFNWSSLSL